MATASKVLSFIVEIEHPGYQNTVWVVSNFSENPARVRLHSNEEGGWWAYLLDVDQDNDDITVSVYDDEGREQILCGEIVSRPTTSEAAQ